MKLKLKEYLTNLLQEPILGVELSQEIKNPPTIKLIPEVQAWVKIAQGNVDESKWFNARPWESL